MKRPLAKIIWTRSISDWGQDCKLFAEYPGAVLHLPCLSFAPVDYDTSGLKSLVTKNAICNVVFTSEHAVRRAFADQEICNFLALSGAIYCFGEKTAEALKVRFPERVKQLIGVNSLRELGSKVVNEIAKVSATSASSKIWVSFGPRQPAFDLIHFLRSHQLNAEYFALYETKSQLSQSDGHPYDEKTLRHDLGDLPRIVCFASPSAVRGFCIGFAFNPDILKKEFIAVALGKTTAQSCGDQFKALELSPSHKLADLAMKALNL